MTWIVIPSWNRFQHYRDRNPTWIKVYTELNSDDAWCGLPLATRGVLVWIWVEYARSRGVLNTERVLGGALRGAGEGTRRAHLQRLADAGFIQFSASKPAPHAASPEKEKEKERTSRGVEKPKPIRLHTDLLEAAMHAATDWNGGSSEQFDSRLEELELEYRDHLSVAERDRLWDTAFGRTL